MCSVAARKTYYTGLRDNGFNMFIPAKVFIKDNTRIFKLSNASYGRPIDNDRELINLGKMTSGPMQCCAFSGVDLFFPYRCS